MKTSTKSKHECSTAPSDAEGTKIGLDDSGKSKSADFQIFCIDGSWLEILQFHTEWRKTRVAESEGTFCSSAEAYRPDASFLAALSHGRLDIVKGLMKEGLSLQIDGDRYFSPAAAAGAARSGSSEMLDFLLTRGWIPSQEDVPSSDKLGTVGGRRLRYSTIS